MKKILLMILTLALFLPISNINAGVPISTSISITKTSYVDGQITIEGTGTGEIQIVLFDLDNLPIYMTTVTAEEGKFLITLPPIDGLTEGTYNIKVSDYDGTNTSTGTVEIEETSQITTEPVKSEVANPPTLDNISTYIISGCISLIGIVVISILIYKSFKNKQKLIKRADA